MKRAEIWTAAVGNGYAGKPAVCMGGWPLNLGQDDETGFGDENR